MSKQANMLFVYLNGRNDKVSGDIYLEMAKEIAALIIAGVYIIK